jgi:ubiquinone/menaquinone biosynthesis C-methylase UbiE
VPVNITTRALSAMNDRKGFDRIAEEYDRHFTYSVIGQAQRSLVHGVLRNRLREGQHILELNCGTGEDAAYLAYRGISVLACDASQSMIDVAREKLSRCAVGLPVTFVVCRNEALNTLPDKGPFDGVLSNFGGLNCSADLSSVAQALAECVRPKGELWLCLMGRFCLWEVLWYSAHRQWKKAFRRLRPGGTEARIGGENIRVFYPSVRQLRAAFSPAFKLAEWRGIGVSVPPSFLEPFFHHHPAVIRLLTGTDRLIGRLPVIRGIADHILFRFTRETE